jgi:acyl carrier protein
VGFLARNAQIKELMQERMGGTALKSGVALDMLGTLLCHCPEAAVGVIDLDWATLKRFLPAAASPKFREIAREGGGSGNSEGSAVLLRWLRGLPADQLGDALDDLLRAEAAKILRITKDKIDKHKSLYDMGMDSLMGVELVTALDQRFGIHLPVMALSEGPSIARLTERILAHLQGEDSGQPSADATGLTQQITLISSQYSSDHDGDEVKHLAEEYTSKLRGH